jgi:hypothetical protein
VQDQPNSCYVTGLEPGNSATVDGANLVLTWDAHPLARSYHIALENADTYEKILDFVATDETSFALSEPLPAGHYRWYVSAENASGDYFAQSDNYEFTVQ